MCIRDSARRVHATAHPARDEHSAVVARVNREVVAAARPVASPLRSIARRAWPVAVAAAAVLVVGVSVGRGRPGPTSPEASITREVDDVLRAPIAAGAASAPSQQIYEARLTAWRDVYLRRGAR